jgi:hypothetical protein
MKIQKNIGYTGRANRIVIGVGLLLLVPMAFIDPELGWALMGLVGVLPLVVGLIGYCPRHALSDGNARGGN